MASYRYNEFAFSSAFVLYSYKPNITYTHAHVDFATLTFDLWPFNRESSQYVVLTVYSIVTSFIAAWP